MDNQAAKAHGAIPIYRPFQKTFQDDMLSGVHAADPSISISMALAMCRFEAARIESFIAHNVSSKYDSDSKFAQGRIRYLHIAIDRFIGNLQVNGVPEEGLSYRVSNARLFVDRHLYKEANGSEAVVPRCWTRVILTMIKLEVDIEYHRIVNRDASGDNATWRELAEACTAYLRAYLHLKRTACYLPYKWFIDRQPPLQVMMCLLKYLEHRKKAKDYETQLSQVARYLVDEVGDIMDEEFGAAETNRRTIMTGGDEDGNEDDNGEQEEMDKRSRSDFATGWRFLSKIKAQLDGGRGNARGSQA